jgi:hypothetical protein
MKRKLIFFAASFMFAAASVFVSTSASANAFDSCRTQCRVAFDKCVKQAKNPGGLNQCRRAFEGCLSGCQ